MALEQEWPVLVEEMSSKTDVLVAVKAYLLVSTKNNPLCTVPSIYELL